MSKSSALKRILLAVFGCFLFGLTYGWMKYNEGGPVPYPLSTGSFFKIGSAIIDPTTLLDDVKNGKKLFLANVQDELPEDTTFVTTIGWSQSDYLEVAEALHKTIWKDEPTDWHLYKVSFYTSCENPTGKFEDADFYYYREIKKDGKIMYAVRNILIEPQYGYIAWGGDSFYPRPIIDRWDKIDLEKITRIPAEKALVLAEQQGGSNIRMGVENVCWIHVNLWPWGYERNGWMVNYGGNIDLHDDEYWIPLE